MSSSSVALVVGASRGFGLELVKGLHKRGHTVYATVRSSPPPGTFPQGVNVITAVDVSEEVAGEKIIEALGGTKVDLTIINAGVFKAETLDKPNFSDEVQMYKTVAIAPVFITHHLRAAKAFAPKSKLILITTEGGSISLRTKEEGGGMYGHHGSKAAANMIGKLLSNDLYDEGILVAMIHPGFMRTEMTKGVGFDKFYDSGGAVEPQVAAESTIDFLEGLTFDKTGTFWAPRGPDDIGEANRVLGNNLPTPLQLPW